MIRINTPSLFTQTFPLPFSSASFYCFKIFSTFSYYLFAAPYKIVISNTPNPQIGFISPGIAKKTSLLTFPKEKLRPAESLTIAHRTKIGKAICLFCHLCVLACLSFQAYEMILKTTFRRPELVYMVISFQAFLLIHFIHFHLTWTKTQGLSFLYRCLFESVQKKSSKDTSPKGRFMIGLLITVNFFTFFAPLVNSIMKTNKLQPTYGQNLFLKYSSEFLDHQSPIVKVVLTIISGVFGQWVRFVVQWNPTLAYVPCIAMYQIGLECSEMLSARKEAVPVQFLFEYYQEAKRVIGVINDVFGPLLLIEATAGCVLLSSAVFGIWNQKADLVTQSATVVNLGTFLLAYMTAAHGCEQLQKIGDYLIEHGNDPEYMRNRDLSLLLSLDLQRSPVGIKAWTFVITYGFLAAICSTVVTYAVVLLQFTMSSSSDPPNNCLCACQHGMADNSTAN